MNKRITFFLFAVLAVALPSTGLAYVGPGAGLGMIGSLIAVIGAILLAVVGVVVLPFRLLRKRRRNALKAKESQGDKGSSEDSSQTNPPDADKPSRHSAN